MRFFKALWLAVPLVVASTAAAGPDRLEAIQSMAEETKRFLDSLDGQAPPEWLDRNVPEPIARRARAVADMSTEPFRTHFGGLNADAPAGTRTYVFLSFSMPEVELKAALREVAAQDQTIAVLKGLAPGDSSVVQTLARLRKLTERFEAMPTVDMDPQRFAAWDVTVAPTVVVTRNGSPAVEARGSIALDWVRSAMPLEPGVRQDLGRRGPVWEVTERDLIEEMKARVLAIDWDAKKKSAINRFWNQYAFHVLPSVSEDTEHRFDPSILVTKDIRTDDGTLIAAAGTRRNPLDVMPLSAEIIAFDATVVAQVEMALELKRQANLRGRRAVLVVSQLDREGGWEAIPRLEKVFRQPVFLLEPGFAARFGIEAVPSVVFAEDRSFVVRSYRVRSAPGREEGWALATPTQEHTE